MGIGQKEEVCPFSKTLPGICSSSSLYLSAFFILPSFICPPLF